MDEYETIMPWVNDIINYGYVGYDKEGDYGLTGYFNREIKQDYNANLEFDRSLKNCDNQAEFLINFSIDFAQRHIDELFDAVKKNSGSEDVPLDAVIIAAAAEIYKIAHDYLSKHEAYFYADDYAKAQKDVGIFDTDAKTWDEGYDKYLSGNIMSISTCINRVAKEYLNNKMLIKR